MRRAREWDEEYIYSLPVQEYDDIEFKGPQWLNLDQVTKPKLTEVPGIETTLDDLAKALSALANSGGGKLVIGVKDPKACKHGYLEVVNGGLPKAIDNKDVAEWLRAKIPTLLDFELKGFEVHPVERAGPSSKIDDDKAVFVIDVPDSDLAPHQSKRDNHYYIRAGGNSVRANHRQVLDIANRRQTPKIELSFRIEVEKREVQMRTFDVAGTEMQRPVEQHLIKLVIIATNTGRVYAKYVNVDVLLPMFCVEKGDRTERVVTVNYLDFYEHRFSNTKRDVTGFGGFDAHTNEKVYNYGPSWFDPILPGRSVEWTVDFRGDYFQLRSSYIKDLAVRWTAYADNAATNACSVLLDDIEVVELNKSAL